MTENPSALESEALDEIEGRLTKDGYRLLRSPGRGDLPDFLQDFQPDAIAVGKLPQIVIEVITREHADRLPSSRLGQLQAALTTHSDWTLRVVYANRSRPRLDIAAPSVIRMRATQVRQLSTTDQAAALVIGWSLLEAATRAALPQQAGQALTPATTVELLASLGYITQSQAARLRQTGKQRNLLVHGDMGVTVASSTVEELLSTVESLLDALASNNTANERS